MVLSLWLVLLLADLIVCTCVKKCLKCIVMTCSRLFSEKHRKTIAKVRAVEDNMFVVNNALTDHTRTYLLDFRSN